MPDGATPTIDDAEIRIEKNLISLRNIYHCSWLVLAKHVAIETITNKYSNLVIYAINNINILLQPPQKRMAVFISSKRCAFMEQHFHSGWIIIFGFMFKCISWAFLHSNESYENRLEEGTVWSKSNKSVLD